jgi:hypothetical protein
LPSYVEPHIVGARRKWKVRPHSRSSLVKHYIYVDNSNLFIEGQRVSAVKQGHAPNIYDAMNKGILDFDWNLDYGHLYQLVCGSPEDVAAARLWGSPPPGDSFWEMVKRKGADVKVYDRNFANKEKKVDTAITYQMAKDAYTIIDRSGAEITLVAGDKDYAPAVEDLVKEGFHVGVAFWNHAAKELRDAATDFFALDKYVDIVGRHRTAR